MKNESLSTVIVQSVCDLNSNCFYMDLDKPDFGERSEIKPGEIPVFWACGVTPQAVAMAVKPEFMITHAPGYMFITDVLNAELSIM